MIEELLPLNSLLSNLNRDQLQLLLLKLAEQEPTLVQSIKSEVASLFHASSDTANTVLTSVVLQHIEIDPQAVRSQIQSIIHSLDRIQSSETYLRVKEVLDMIGEILDQARALIEAKDGHNAMTLLKAITEGYMATGKSLMVRVVRLAISSMIWHQLGKRRSFVPISAKRSASRGSIGLPFGGKNLMMIMDLVMLLTLHSPSNKSPESHFEACN